MKEVGQHVDVAGILTSLDHTTFDMRDTVDAIHEQQEEDTGILRALDGMLPEFLDAVKDVLERQELDGKIMLEYVKNAMARSNNDTHVCDTYGVIADIHSKMDHMSDRCQHIAEKVDDLDIGVIHTMAGEVGDCLEALNDHDDKFAALDAKIDDIKDAVDRANHVADLRFDWLVAELRSMKEGMA